MIIYLIAILTGIARLCGVTHILYKDFAHMFVLYCIGRGLERRRNWEIEGVSTITKWYEVWRGYWWYEVGEIHYTLVAVVLSILETIAFIVTHTILTGIN